MVCGGLRWFVVVCGNLTVPILDKSLFIELTCVTCKTAYLHIKMDVDNVNNCEPIEGVNTSDSESGAKRKGSPLQCDYPLKRQASPVNHTFW